MTRDEKKAREIVDRVWPGEKRGADRIVQAITTALTEARREERERCAGIAHDACLVPPDGGSMTEDERRICEDIAAAIMRDSDYLPWEDTLTPEVRHGEER